MKTIQQELANIREGNIAPIYLVLGEEQYFIEQIKETLVKHALEEDAIDLNFSNFDMAENTINDALFEAASFPFFGDRKLVFIQNPFFLTGKKVKKAPEHNIEELEDYLNNPADFSILVFFAPYEKLDGRKKISKLMKKEARVIDVSSPRPNEASRYIKEVVKEKGYRFSEGAFQLFTERTDGDLTSMMHELDKLFLYHADSKNISKQAIQELVPKTLEQNVFELNTKVLNKQVEASIEIYHDLLVQKEEPIKIVALLMSQFRLLLQTKILQKQGYQQKDIAKALKVHPYRVKLALQNIRKYDQDLLSEALNYLIDADFKMKTGQIDQELQVELFIMRFAQQRNVHA
jgi:DNA polymerase-3 subunit delta